MHTDSEQSLLVLGFDGATFDFIIPLAAKGLMPNAARLMREGSFARLNSTVPAVTPVAWTSMITGVNPGKHGIFDGHQLDLPSETVRFASASMRSSPSLWSLLGKARSAVLNVPVTYPPEKIDGFIAAGMFAPPGAADAIYPEAMAREFVARFGPLAYAPPMFDDRVKYLDSLLNGIEKRLKMILWLIERGPWELLFAVFMESDLVQHFFWRYRNPSEPLHSKLGQAIEQVYQALDRALGKVMAAVGAKAHIALVSDHGAGPLHTGVFLNRWLMDQGYLRLTQDFEQVFSLKNAAGPGLLRRAASKAASLLAPDLAGKRRDAARQEQVARMNNLFRSIIDWDRSVAWSDGIGGGIYFNRSRLPDRESLCESISQGLKELSDPRSGVRVFSEIHRREAIYHGPRLSEAADLILVCAPGYQVYAPHDFLINRHQAVNELFVSHPWSGRHEAQGIFVLHGPKSKAGDLGSCEMVDVTPTFLSVLDKPLPDWLDGKPLPGISGEPAGSSSGSLPGPEQAQGERELSEAEREALIAQMKTLGYM